MNGLIAAMKEESIEIQNKFQAIKGSNIHYLEAGSGDPIVFLHGMPASSYMWRNIIPSVKHYGKCIAPDLIGMGKSSKPNITYSIFDHIDYMDAFINSLNLNNITFVLHGWGSVIGFHYAMTHSQRIKGIAFYEAHVYATSDWEMLSLPVQQVATMLSNKEIAYKAVIQNNYIVEKLLPKCVLRELDTREMEAYRAPFTSPESRQVLWQYLQDLPLGEGESKVSELINNYSEWLQESSVPKLLLYNIPGLFTTVSQLMWCKRHLPNLTMVDLGEALHFAPETIPNDFAQAIISWLKTK